MKREALSLSCFYVLVHRRVKYEENSGEQVSQATENYRGERELHSPGSDVCGAEAGWDTGVSSGVSHWWREPSSSAITATCKGAGDGH